MHIHYIYTYVCVYIYIGYYPYNGESNAKETEEEMITGIIQAIRRILGITRTMEKSMETTYYNAVILGLGLTGLGLIGFSVLPHPKPQSSIYAKP